MHVRPILDEIIQARLQYGPFFLKLMHPLSGDIDFRERRTSGFYSLLNWQFDATLLLCISEHVIMHSDIDSLIDFQGPC